MPSLRIGIDVGGTFTHGVILRPPGEVVASARVPTTHTATNGVAEGVRQVLALLLEHADAADIELVAHSTTQATNALLEGDVAPVILAAIVPPGEGLAVSQALPEGRLDLGGGHHVEISRVLIPWEDAARFEPPGDTGGAGVPARDLLAGTEARPTGGAAGSVPPQAKSPAGMLAPPDRMPVAVVQPLAGKHELREELIAAKYRALGHPVVCAADITQVLGLAARARTAVVNASMLLKMLATARFTAQAVAELLPGVPVQVVRSDGGAMSLSEMQRLPVLSLLSGPAAGASAALARSGLSNVVFIEVGGTSTDITLIKDGRVRHRYATVGGQRLLVPALDLRTVAVGGGSMLRADAALFGPRSAHIAGLPYLFQALQSGLTVAGWDKWKDERTGEEYAAFRMSDGSLAAYTLTDYRLVVHRPETVIDFGFELTPAVHKSLKEVSGLEVSDIVEEKSGDQAKLAYRVRLNNAYLMSCVQIVDAIRELTDTAPKTKLNYTLVAGGGGAPGFYQAIAVYACCRGEGVLIPNHAVISAIGAALAVSCVSLSKSVAEPSAGDIAELTAEVERRLSAQGAERVSTDYEFDAQRQVLTVTGRGSQPYAQDAQVRSQEELHKIANRLVVDEAYQLWQSDQLSLWQAADSGGQDRQQGSVAREKHGLGAVIHKLLSKPEPGTQAILLNHYGQCLWQGWLREFWPADGGERETVLKRIIELRTQYTDGGPVLPGLALACVGRLIPLDQLASADLIAEVLRWEQLPASAGGCFLLRG
jgi:N-methylhydantoinase A